MNYLSLCSGIEAASVAWKPLDWEPIGFSEIEAFPSAVLAARYPHTPNFGDMTKYESWNIEPGTVDILVGGTPCQSFSVAGLRKGIADPRGNLALVYIGMVDHFRPRWVIWENVPGVLSSNVGRDFGAFIGALAELGYSFAYRVLDAQYWGVPQRRRRVFVVGHLGDWRGPAKVLFDSPGGCRNTPARRQARSGIAADVAPCIGASGRGFSRCGETRGQDPVVACEIAPCLTATSHQIGERTGADPVIACMAHGQANAEISADGSTPTLSCIHEAPITDLDPTKETLYNQGISCEERYARAQKTDSEQILRILRQEIGEEAFTEWGFGILVSFYPQEVLRSVLHGFGLRCPTVNEFGLVDYALSCPEIGASRFVRYMRQSICAGRSSFGWGPHEQQTLQFAAYLSQLSQPGTSAARIMQNLWQAGERDGVLRKALSEIQKIWQSNVEERQQRQFIGVRRLVPVEAEFLQGFPRNYTLINYRGKPAADGPRYKALGNSMAVPVMRWIGERIQMTEDCRCSG